MGETLSADTREAAAKAFGAQVADMYSSQELGNIALQCPESDVYHVMAENLIVEVLKDDGSACQDGEVGRVVVTDLRNFATPLFRYEIGDYAEVGASCSCGRGLPTLRRVLGRERNLILMPDGNRHWPLVGFQRFRSIAPIVQYQFVQESRTSIKMRLVVERALSAEEEDALRALVQRMLEYPFDLRIIYFDERIPAGAGGKFEEFICNAS
jgi:phenylacetate-CoA ligase